MPDRNKVIAGLEHCTATETSDDCAGCPYDGICGNDPSALERDALALLRESKPIVFCGDCKYWNAGTCLNDNVSRQIEDCGCCYPDFVTDSNWFCAEGERR